MYSRSAGETSDCSLPDTKNLIRTLEIALGVMPKYVETRSGTLTGLQSDLQTMYVNYALEAGVQVLSKFRAASRTRNVAYTVP